jgi:hypothetical protein
MKKFCLKHRVSVEIDPWFGDDGCKMVVCEHTFREGIFECNEPCVYSLGAQMGGVAGTRLVNGCLNPDGTIPLDILKECGGTDYTQWVG